MCIDWTGELQESIAEELLAQQVTMAQCIEQLETCEMSHAMLVSNLRDALHEQVCQKLGRAWKT
jgi:hypothetical protein